ncbi:protein-glutamate methylesterase/protein-glutamine glutaminase [Gilvimarinus polysaccharolyticus]|uniref:protein-glutamate methylesterase/protein-glutamine glutaminase n=1 Tax=Gilvimarinus polysaccharolyticus TaxID=863921 RepID=UPI000673B8FF|nr:chemotaxis response regulator protein-glutamate methylesterase [Gilvimarinus polysaccharolyticus]
MPVRVLIVDDSQFFQSRLKDIINQNPQLEVVGIASNGQQGVELARSLKPDVITMDFEMPVMDGVTAVRTIMAERSVPILMFSSLTYEGARITLDALAAGAVDFLPKDFAEVSRNSIVLKQKLHERLLALSGGSTKAINSAPKTPDSIQYPEIDFTQKVASRDSNPRARVSYPKPNLVVIGASTGGPVALMEVLSCLPASFNVPILLVQHMPENFTRAFSERLNKQCAIEVREAVDGDHIKPGLALLAPGGKQMMIDRRGVVKILADDARVNYKPSLDITFGSAANTYADRVLGVVLTGMGSDGCKGAGLLKQRGAQIWGQDKDSCVIYGMPMAVARENLTDRVLSLKEIGPALAAEVR